VNRDAELASVLDRVAGALRGADVPWFVTGSLASSVHGEFRATNDIDIVAALDARSLRKLLDPLSGEFVCDFDEAARAIGEGRSFNLIHRETLLKVDLFPLVSAFDREGVQRAEPLQFPGAREVLRVATREDILLAKLQWFRLGGESSSTQRRDIERLVALNQGDFDVPYLLRWAAALEVGDLLRRFYPQVDG
jgi:hypothetical protein